MNSIKNYFGDFFRVFCVVVFFSAIQFLIVKMPTVAGIDADKSSTSLALQYPLVVLSELIKIWALITLFILPLYFLAKKTAERLKGKIRRPRTFVLAGIFASYTSFLASSALLYPALYENNLPAWVNKIIFSMSFHFSPVTFSLIGVLILGGTLLYRTNLVIPWPMTFTNQKKIGNKTDWILICALVGFVGWYFLGNQTNPPQHIPKTESTPNLAEKNAEHIAAPQNPSPPSKDIPPPNIILIGIDSLRYDRLQNKTVTPVLSNLLNEPDTIIFKDHHVGIPRTFPSWVELLSGNYGPTTGIRHMFPSLPQQQAHRVTAASLLSLAGFQTSVISDFAGDIFPRVKLGFGSVLTPNMNISTLIRQQIDLMFPAFFPVLLWQPARFTLPDLRSHPAFADPSDLTQRIIAELKSFDGRPFFLTAFYSTAHFPYAAPWPYYSKFSAPEYPGPHFFQKNPELQAGRHSSKIVDIAQIRNLYDGAVASIDNSLQTLFSYLKKTGKWKDTLIIVTADHGEDLFEGNNLQGHGEHLRGEKVLKVPLVMKLNSQLLRKIHTSIAERQSNSKNTEPWKLSKTVSSLTRSIDIGPTIIAAAGLSAHESEGTSLIPILTKQNRQATQRSSYSETGIWFSNQGSSHFQVNRIAYPGITDILKFDPGNTRKIILNEKYENIIVTAKHRSLIVDNYKIIYMPTNDGVKYELYDRLNDPYNLIDLSLAEPEKLDELKRKIREVMQKLENSRRIVDEYVVPNQ